MLSIVSMANNPLKVKVLDENKEPLPGVKLTEVKEKTTLFTDFDGESTIERVSGIKIFKVDYVGYQSGYIKITSGDVDEVEVVLIKK